MKDLSKSDCGCDSVQVRMFDVLNDKMKKIEERTGVKPVEVKNHADKGMPAISGIETKFRKKDYGKEIDKISPSVALTRGNAAGLYNKVTSEGWSSPGPTYTYWSSAGQKADEKPSDSKYESKPWDKYSINEMTDWPWGAWVSTIENKPLSWLDRDLFMLDTTTGIIWKMVFYSWTQGGQGGGFTYKRIAVAVDDAYTLRGKLGV